MRFGKAIITKLNSSTYKMTITSYYLYFFPYVDVYVFTSMEQAKTKLLQIRCRDHIEVIDESGEEMGLRIFDITEKNEEKQNTNIPNVSNVPNVPNIPNGHRPR